MINFINFVFSFKPKHGNKSNMEIIHPLPGILFFVSQKTNLQLIELEWRDSKQTGFYGKIEDENITERK